MCELLWYSGHHQRQKLDSCSFFIIIIIISLHTDKSASWNISLKQCDHRRICRQFEGCVHWTQCSSVHPFPGPCTSSQTTKGKARMFRSLPFKNKKKNNANRITAKDLKHKRSENIRPSVRQNVCILYRCRHHMSALNSRGAWKYHRFFYVNQT